MRKYFLLSAVALLVATSANATTDYAEVTASANIELASNFSCSDLNFGNIVVKKNNVESIISFDGPTHTYSGDIILADTDTTGNNFQCNFNNDDGLGEFPVHTLELTADGVDTKLALEFGLGSGEYYEANLLGTLTIPANVKAGYYSKSFTIMLTY